MKTRKATNRIMLHCTATPPSMEVTASKLWEWHVEQNGWSSWGYHWLIQLDGTVVPLRDEHLQGAGCAGQNFDTIHVAYAGGVASDGQTAKDTLNPAQEAAMLNLLDEIQERYPNMDSDSIVGHNQYAAKACPSFDVPSRVEKWMAEHEEEDTKPFQTDVALGLALEKMQEVVDAHSAKIEWLEEINRNQAKALQAGKRVK